MKKNIIAASLFSLLTLTGSTVASTGDIQFNGVVTSTTCDVKPSVGGAVNNLIQLGTVAPSAQGSLVNFSLKPDISQNGCSALTSTNVVTISWTGTFNANGLAAQSGAATDAWTEIKHTNATGAATTINATSLSSSIAGDKFIESSGQGALFTAQLNGGSKPGDYQAAAAYMIAYN
ncbi:TPA: fimbrial protein PefA [Salmonella enterica]|nr:fimbrial protein PefA [Salmonella enterica subsp. diarizonae]HDC2661437.1 fimbrial protein PefA [Salmonella enterica]